MGLLPGASMGPATTDVRRTAEEGHEVCVRPAYALEVSHQLSLEDASFSRSFERACGFARCDAIGFGRRSWRASSRYRRGASPFGGGIRGGAERCGRPCAARRLVHAPSGGLLDAGEHGRRLRPSSERGPQSSGLCPFVVAVAEVDRRQSVSNKLSRAPQKGNAARVNGDLARRSLASVRAFLRAKS